MTCRTCKKPKSVHCFAVWAGKSTYPVCIECQAAKNKALRMKAFTGTAFGGRQDGFCINADRVKLKVRP